MAANCKRWYRSRRNQLIFLSVIITLVLIHIVFKSDPREDNLDLTRRDNIFNFIEGRIKDALKEDKGSGCTIPKLDPFSKEVTQFDNDMPPVVCAGTDWVRCYLSECKVIDSIIATVKHIKCNYQDIIFVDDNNYHLSAVSIVKGRDVYTLIESDHVKVNCAGANRSTGAPTKWSGFALGFRNLEIEPNIDNSEGINVLMLGFDSTSRNGFIRRMPKSYKVITEVLGATVLNGYNIVGDGTPAALFPILTGKSELELPDVRRRSKKKQYLDNMPFIFFDARRHGYRTAYFEDMPWIGTFQYRFNGFQRQPTDHYLRSFFMEETNSGSKWWKKKVNDRYCVGDRPTYSLMFDSTKQFMDLDGKKFCFTFIADITHDDFNMITTADDYFSKYLIELLEQGYLDNTLLVVMGDHGPRFANVRSTLQGKQEERLPLMALRLPQKLTKSNPKLQVNLNNNANVLATPFDVHTTFLYCMGMPQYKNTYFVPGSEIVRSFSLLAEIPKNRSCSEAGIEPHWCACLHWNRVSDKEHAYEAAVNALIAHINRLTQDVRDKCAIRTLISTEWVMRQVVNKQMLKFKKNKDADGYLGLFADDTKIHKEHYEVKIVVGPGRGVYEAFMVYNNFEDKFTINTTDISRTNAYGDEPACVSKTRPDLNMYCYCNK